MRTTILYWHDKGPLIEYSGGALTVQNINPFMETRWRWSRKDMLLLAWRALLAAIS